ncbi:MAG: N-acetylmuramoyl-L-alanine amidase [Planctomycetes bacterium]|nr:N-acetylmuramoyl-L-alanine amidase [Planctomycetota bacterium]
MGDRERRREKRRPPAVGRLLALLFWLAVLGWAGWQLQLRRERGEWPWTLWSSRGLGGVVVLPRSSWGAAAGRETPPRMDRPRRITLHHLGGRAVEELDRVEAGRTIKAIQQDHVGRRGWDDIGYHYVVDRSGRVWEGRPITRVGAHAGSAEANEGNIGVLLLGNFDLQAPAPRQLESARRLLDALRRKHGIARSSVSSHDDVRRGCGLAPTSCPGKGLAEWLERYREGGESSAMLEGPCPVSGAPDPRLVQSLPSKSRGLAEVRS